ncbi:MAG: hypothetical protein OXG33_11770 [Chloroflexi bacterium]|nr:hypothetical protein [Chloroflexota bacterium]
MESHLLGVPSPYGSILRHGDAVTQQSVAGHDDDLLHEALDEGPTLRQLALVEEHAQVPGVGRDGLHVVQDLPALGEDAPGLLRRRLQPLLPLPVVPDAGLEVLDVQVRGLRQVVESSQPALHVLKLRLDGLKFLALLLGDAVHLLVHQPNQLPDVGLGEHVLPYLPHHHLLEATGVEPGGLAGVPAPLHDGLADVVGVLSALGVLAGERPVARPALDHPAQQVAAPHPARMRLLGGASAHPPVDSLELGLGDDAGKRLLHSDRLILALPADAPEEGSRVGFVAEDDVDAVLRPEPARGVGDALGVEGLGDVQDAPARLGHVEDATHHGSSGGIGFQGRALLGPVLHHALGVAVGHPAGDPEAS